MNAKEFPLLTQAENVFNAVKNELEVASLNPIDEAMPFVVECNASESTISAIINQAGRQVALMSRTLQGSELPYPAVEKEATPIIEAVRGSYIAPIAQLVSALDFNFERAVEGSILTAGKRLSLKNLNVIIRAIN